MRKKIYMKYTEREPDIEKLLVFAILAFLIFVVLSLTGCGSLAVTNPCLYATAEWQEAQARQGKEIGMVWYYPDAGDRYHCIGYEWVEGERRYYEPQWHKYVRLNRWDRYKGLRHYPYNFAVEIVKE